MRTAVVRVDVDRAGELTSARLTDGMTTLRGLADDMGATVVENDIAAMPAGRRHLQSVRATTVGDSRIAGHRVPGGPS